ncbi:MAG: hypothetical protein WCR52_16850 [Bacteroidota bacterium]
MNTLHLTCLGGCINKQPGVQPNEHYHAVFAQNLSRLEPPIHVSVSIGAYLSIDRMVERADQLMQANRPDLLCVYVRPFSLMPLHKLLIRYEKADKRAARALHPCLFNRKMAWNPRLSQFQTDWPFVFEPRSRFGLRDCNLLAGLILGLHSWARRYVLLQLDLLQTRCEKHGTRLIVMTPAQNPDSVMGNYLCERAFQAIDRFCTEKGILMLNAHRFGLEYFEADQLHFIPEVHREMGEELTGLVVWEIGGHRAMSLT